MKTETLDKLTANLKEQATLKKILDSKTSQFYYALSSQDRTVAQLGSKIGGKVRESVQEEYDKLVSDFKSITGHKNYESAIDNRTRHKDLTTLLDKENVYVRRICIGYSDTENISSRLGNAIIEQIRKEIELLEKEFEEM